MSSTNACMMLWLKTFCEIRWTVMSRSNELRTGLWTIYCPKRGKLAGLGYSYPSKPSLSPRRRPPACKAYGSESSTSRRPETSIQHHVLTNRNHLVFRKPWPRPGMQGLNFIAPAYLILKGQQFVTLTSRQGGLDTNFKILAYIDI